MCKIDKIIKNQNEILVVKNFLQPKYYLMYETSRSLTSHSRDCYKFYAAISPASGVPSISQSHFQDIFVTAGIFNDKFKLSDLDLEFVAMKSGTENISNSPTKNVIRYQMLEMILRLGAQKYHLRSNSSPVEAL